MKPRIHLLATSLAVFSMTQPARAASGTWDGSTDGTWHEGTNWSSEAIPNAAENIATFDSSSPNTTVSIGAVTTTVDRINISGATVPAYTLTGTGSTNLVMSTTGGGVFVGADVTADQDLSGIPIIRPGMGDTINFSNQGSGLLKLGTFQAQNVTGSLSTLNFTPGATGNIEIAAGKVIDNAASGSKKIAIILDDVGTLKIAAIGSYDGTNAESNSVSIRRGTLQAAVIKNSSTPSSLGGGGRVQFGQATMAYTATLDYYGTLDTATDRVFHIIDNNTAVFKVSGGASTNLAITSGITQSGATSGGGKLTKDGAGILTLGASNGYSGPTTIKAGKLVAGHANALGTAGSFNSRTTINTGGTLELATDDSVANEFLDITSGNTGAVVVNRATEETGITHATGSTYLGSASTLNVTQGAKVTSGTATLGIASVILASNSVGTGTLNADTAAISVTGPVSSAVPFAKTLALTGSHAGSAISGVISNGSGTVALTKSGSGTWTLTKANIYSGDTTVNAGTLVLADGGSQKFYPKADGSSNKITDSDPTVETGDGMGVVTLDGALAIDLTDAAAAANGTEWLLVDVAKLAETYGSSFSVTDFTETPADSGIWKRTEGANTYTFTQGTGKLSLAVATLAGFNSWITKPEFGTPSDITTTGDPENDGIENLVEYALNGNPSVSDPSILPSLNTAGTTFVFTYNRLDLSLADTIQTFQYGSNLSGWTSIVVPATNATVGAATITVTDNGATDSVSISIPKTEAGPGGKLFGRLQVTKP